MESRNGNILALALLVLGLVAMAAQVIVIREFLAAFQGNELIIGLIMGAWMLLTGAGAYLISKTGIKSPVTLLMILQTVLGTLPGIMLVLLAMAKSHFIPAGAMGGMREIIIILFIVLAPFCLVSGMLFPLLAGEYSRARNKNMVAKAYALDSAGSIAGGLIFSLFFIFILTNIQGMLVLAVLSFASALLLAWTYRKWSLGGGIILIATVYVLFLHHGKPDERMARMLFPHQEVLETRITPFGKLVVTRTGDQLNLFENSVPVVTGEDIVAREESVHYGMALHPSPQKVLMISGGVGGTLEEVLKYPVEKLDYLEINPWLIRLAGDYELLTVDRRVSIIHQDPRIFLNRVETRYDVILLNAPEPISAELNRYFTVEFYRLLKSGMDRDGILSLSIPAAGNYMSEASRALHSVTWHTLREVFGHIRIIPGERDYYLASESDLTGSILDALVKKDIDNLYVNPFYLREELMNARSELIMKELYSGPVINQDLRPYSYSQALRYWMSLFQFDGRIILFSLAGLAILAFVFFGPLNLGLFASGFTSSSVVFLLMIWMQVVYGFIYQMTGVVFAVFMAGLAIGSHNRLLFYKNSTFRGFLTIQAAIGAYCILMAAVMHFIPSSTSWLVILLILLLVAASGLLTGIHFSLSAHLRKSGFLQSSGEAFSADLFGSAIGIGLVAVYVLPSAGLPMTGGVLALLNIATIGLIALKGRILR